MRKLQILIAIVLLAAFTACNQTTAEDEGGGNKSASKMKRYGIKKACIKYKVTGDMMSGKEVLYFDDWGAREAKYTTNRIKMGGVVMQETEQIAFTEGNTIYSVDQKTGTGTKASVSSIMKPFEGQDLDDVGEKMMKPDGR